MWTLLFIYSIRMHKMYMYFFLFQGIKLFLLNKQVLINKHVNALFVTNPEKERIPYNERGKKTKKLAIQIQQIATWFSFSEVLLNFPVEKKVPKFVCCFFVVFLHTK